jgi:hypothetical protein
MNEHRSRYKHYTPQQRVQIVEMLWLFEGAKHHLWDGKYPFSKERFICHAVSRTAGWVNENICGCAHDMIMRGLNGSSTAEGYIRKQLQGSPRRSSAVSAHQVQQIRHAYLDSLIAECELALKESKK